MGCKGKFFQAAHIAMAQQDCRPGQNDRDTPRYTLKSDVTSSKHQRLQVFFLRG